MINILIEISTYLIIAILLGYLFGWLITSLILKEKYQNYLDEFIKNKNLEQDDLKQVKEELYQCKKERKELKQYNKKMSLSYGGQKHVLDEHNATLDTFQKRLLSKDEVISSMVGKLSLVEEEHSSLAKRYEEEIDAFMFERIELTEKYKKLLAESSLGNKNKSIWFSKLFSSSTPSVN